MLSILIWLPLAAALLGALGGARALAGRIALVGALGALGLSIALIVGYDGHTGGLQHVTDIVWIASLGIHYKLGLDGLNVFLVALATLLFAGTLVAANLRSWAKPQLFYFQIGLAESAVLGAFLAQDLALFVAFFDLMLIPFYFLTGVWGGADRVRATTKLVIYTLVGSLLMLAGAIATAVLTAHDSGHALSFVFSDLRSAPLPGGTQDWIFLLFAAAFLVKMPAFPLHGWMPDGYRAMPIEVLMVFSGVLSKVGAYGFLRIVLPLFPGASAHFQTLLLVIGLASILYGSAMAFTQTNVRLIAGYSSVAQLGFITIGIFSLTPQGAQGAVLQMVNHGLVVAPLFFIIALLSARAGGSEDIREMGGIATRAPVLATLFLVVALATLAMPGSGNFAGEFLILLGVFSTKVVFAIVAFAGVVMAAVYSLRLYIRAMHNRPGPDVHSREMRLIDGVVLVPFILVILLFALYPQLELRRAEKSVTATVSSAETIACVHGSGSYSGGWTSYVPGGPGSCAAAPPAGGLPVRVAGQATSGAAAAVVPPTPAPVPSVVPAGGPAPAENSVTVTYK
jgi:NADH-quinone oxidoreductase subunit M